MRFPLAPLAALVVATAAHAQTGTVNSFERDADAQMLKPHNARAAVAAERATDGSRALRMDFEVADWPNVMFAPAKPWDWSGTGGIGMDVTNPGKAPVRFNIRVDDDPSADGVVHCRTGSSSIEPGKTAHFVMPLGAKRDPMAYGMRGLPGIPGVRDMGSGGSGAFDASHVVQFQIFLDHPTEPVTLYVDNIRTESFNVSMDGIVDRYGQYAKADWPGKLHAESELASRRAQEEAALKASPALSDRDAVGGWAKGPKLKATGFFRTEKVNGKWWLVTPEGHLFFSNGIDCVTSDLSTGITSREAMFTWLPPKDGPLGKQFGRFSNIHSGPVKEGTSFNWFGANLERKYGADYQRAWFDLALRRLPAWGFNTVANWSDQRLYRNGKVPYVATGGVWGDHARVSSGSDYWGQMHDPFDPKFEADVATSLKDLVARVKGDPLCVGYFIDNELSWGGGGDEGGRYGLAYGALAAPAGQPAKQAIVAQLKAKYADVAKLNAAWGTTFASWDALDGPVKLPSPANAAAHADLGAFVKEFARHYFRPIRDYLKREDPDHLYLGCRFAWKTEEAVEAAAEICDVVSFNVYAPRLDPKAWASVQPLDKPCIIGEFHFGALDRGMFHTGLVATESQAARAAMYKDYVESVLDNPAFVGCHWFQFVDEPLTGRVYDGENYNIGFLTVTDTPYPEMVAAAKAVHAEVYTRRYK